MSLDTDEKRSILSPHRASGVVPDGAGPVLLAATTGSAVALGILHFVVTRYFDLLLLFYFAVGGGIGYIAHRIIRARRIRAPMLAAALVLSGAPVAWLLSEVAFPLAHHWHNNDEFLASKAAELGTTQSEAFRLMIMGELSEAGDASARARPPREVASWLETGIAFVNLRARLGVTVVHHGHANKHGFGMSLVLMLGELLSCCFVAAGIAFDTARTPHCEQCGQWYSVQGSWLAGKSKKWGAVVAALRRGDAEGLSRFAAEAQDEKRDILLLDVSRCPSCRISPAHLRLALRNRKWSLRIGGLSGVVAVEAADRLIDALSGRSSAAAPRTQ